MASKKKTTALVKNDKRRFNGGAARGGGRKAGTATRLTRARADEISKSGESPLDVMFDNMVFWHRAAKSLGEQLEQMMLEGVDEDDREKAMKLIRNFLAARENSQHCAVDAAPYVHPKLSSIAFKGSLDATLKTEAILGTMTPQEAAEAYKSMLK